MTANRQQYFEDRYRREAEPWDYSDRAAEVLRHRWVAQTAGELGARRAVDLGCSLGQITDGVRRCSTVGSLVASDVSPTALERARATMASKSPGSPAPQMPEFVAASALALPFAPGAFDLIIASDGLHSWRLDRSERAAALREILVTLSPGGHAIITEHLQPKHFTEFLEEIREAALNIVSVTYPYDRPWYQFEAWFKSVRRWEPVRSLFRIQALARGLSVVGSLIGPKASRHIYVIARRRENAGTPARRSTAV
ncbi:MAG: class I SAM-dependent methyltransferase [Gemmatimonadaceae bacterium]|jgi:SAM-dependent methyltransferase